MKVSVVLPTRNSIRYLDERIASIRSQSLRDFEVVIVDTASTDGTLEKLCAWRAQDQRVTIYDVPPGLYAAFNFGIRVARGEYVYIATSDDTMRPDALEKMVAALETHPDCDICDTPVEEIDENGTPLVYGDKRYLHCAGHLLYPRDRMHIRRPPYDFLQHGGAKTVYISLTEILVRRSLFERVGYFPEDRGPSGDYLWGMRASRVASVIYLPERLATWRIHPEQLTGHGAKLDNFTRMTEMAADMFAEESDKALKRSFARLRRLADFKATLMPMKNDPSIAKKVTCLLATAFRHPWLLLIFLPAYFVTRFLLRSPYCKIDAYDFVYRFVTRSALHEAYPIVGLTE